MASQYAILCTNHNPLTTDASAMLSHFNSKSLESYLFYPGLEQSDEDETDPTAQSYDIQMDQDIGFHQRQRSNTAQKLEQMNLAKKRMAKIKIIKCDESFPSVLSEMETQFLFERKPVKRSPAADQHVTTAAAVVASPPTTDTVDKSTTVAAGRPISRLAKQLTESSRQCHNKYFQYARFDGTHQNASTKKIKIFMTMLPADQRNYPMEVFVISTAKIQEFIGLICYKSSIVHADVQLLSIENYGLYITEEDGEIDFEFPPLDLREPCSKFCFSHLSLVVRKPADSRPDARAMSMTSEVESIFQESLDASTKQTEDLAKMLGHTTMMEAPLYRSYRVRMVIKGFFKAEIQLGVSGEKLEIDPIQPQHSFWTSRQKAISYCMDSIAWCELTNQTSAYNATIRIVYSVTSPQEVHQSKAGTMMAIQTSTNFKHYDFVTNAVDAREIVQKINNIIEVRSSGTRREYLAKRSLTSTNTTDGSIRSSGGGGGGGVITPSIVDKRKVLGKISPKKKASV